MQRCGKRAFSARHYRIGHRNQGKGRKKIKEEHIISGCKAMRRTLSRSIHSRLRYAWSMGWRCRAWSRVSSRSEVSKGKSRRVLLNC